MSGNRPRPSIINLFDPLANSTTSEIPSTPRRDASDADKENHNSSPNSLTMTMFINKIANPTFHPQPAPLKRRLIDLGDMTLEDAACPEALSVESMEEEFSAGFDQADDEENATLTFKDMVKAATPIRTLKTVVESPTSDTFPAAKALFADIVQEKATLAPQPESGSAPFLPEGSLEGLDTENSVAEAILEVRMPEEANHPKPVIEPSVTPEDIPLPPSPIVAAREFAAPDPVNDVRDYSGEIPPDCGSTNLDVSMPEMTEEQLLNLHILNSSSASAEPAGLVQSSEALLADTSIPIVVSLSSPPIPAAPLPESEQETDKQNSPVARLRPHPSNTSPNDHNRFSVDLHASFQMQMQSDDMSFDLLSDRLSFFNSSGGESFLSTIEDDPSFDLETERINMEKALKTCSGGKDTKEDKVTSADDVSSVSSSPAPATPVDVPGTPLTPGHQSGDSRTTNGSDLKTVRKRMSIPIAISSPRLIDISSPSTRMSPLLRSPSLSLSGLNAPSPRSPVTSAGPVFSLPTSIAKRRSSLQLTTPKSMKESAIPSLPPAIPALKIVKRSRTNGHERNDSTSSSTEQKGTSSNLPNVPELPATALLKTRKPTKEQEVPQAIEPEARPSRQVPRPRSLVPPRPTPPVTQTNGPRRVPISEGPQLKPAAPRSGTTPGASAAGPRRVPAPATSALPTAQPRSMVAPSGLKAPTQFGMAATASSTASSLPKPISRTSTLTSKLPAPKSLLKPGGLPSFRRTT